jgi:excisionase family DNA binding protein
MPEERWLSTEDAARLIGGVTSRWIRRQIEAGRIRSRMLATGARVTYRIRRDDLEAFVAAYILEDARDRTDRG